MFENCIFDLYGTLVDIHTEEKAPELWKGLAADFIGWGAKYTPEELRDAYFSLVEQEEQAMGAGKGDDHEAHPEIKLESVFRQLFAAKGVKADDDLILAAGRRFRQLSLIFIKLYDGVPEMLAALRKAGKNVWLLSNAQRMFTAFEMDTLGITDAFDGIYLSSDYGVKKPNSRFFGILLEEQKINPQTAVMVGNDGKCDIQGAKAVGLSTVYIHSDISPDEPMPDADFCLAEMNIPKVQEYLLR